MPKRIAVSNLQGTTMDILNAIRTNASLEYQNLVPVVTTEKDIPHVGEVLFGYPALANQFLNALMNRIAMVKARSMVFNNPYADLKKGTVLYGETIEEIFVGLVKAEHFNPEDAPNREFRRHLPDVKSAFHIMNWQVQYPITISEEQLRQAFLSLEGVTDMIARIVDSIYQSANVDEYLLFKYLIIKGVTSGQVKPVSIEYTGAGSNETQMKNTAIKLRAMSNQLTFPSTEYNAAGVTTVTPREDQVIFMDSQFNAQYDVDVLAAAFNMSKADFMGRLYLIDDFATFDNERFAQIRKQSDGIEEVTAAELELMRGVHAFVADKEWFQVYDNLDGGKFTEKYVASGLYWNYFFHVWKTVSYSPYANAIVYATGIPAAPETIPVEVQSKSIGENATVLTVVPHMDAPAFQGDNLVFQQNRQATSDGIAVHPYGAFIFPPTKTEVTMEASLTDATGVKQKYMAQLATTANVGDTINLTRQTGRAATKAATK